MVAPVRPIHLAPLTLAVAMAIGLPASAQRVSLVPTIFNGNPFRGTEVRTTVTTGERISINVLVDTRDTEVEIDAVTIAVRFPAGALTKVLQREGDLPGTGWPVSEGVPVIATASELPDSIRPQLGMPFITVSGSNENPECPCEAENGAGMETIVHFLLVDAERQRYLAPGLHHLFQTDWKVAEDCDLSEFFLEISDGPGPGLRALGDPSRNFLLDYRTDRVFTLSDGLEASPRVEMQIRCRSQVQFLRGDPTSDGLVDISDAIAVLSYLFLGGTLPCEIAADADGSGSLEITDPIFLLRFLFLSGVTVPEPYPTCGIGFQVPGLICRHPCE